MMNEYSASRIVADRQAEARRVAEWHRLIDRAREPRLSLRARAGRAVVGLGMWLGGPGLQARQALR
jgi:hypothetical protein